MAASVAQELHVAGRGLGRSVPIDSGARLSHALLSYLVVLIAALTLLPFEFAVPDRIEPALTFIWLSTLAQVAMFVPYGFFTRRARTGRLGQHQLAIALSSGMFALALETAQLFEPSRDASPWHILAAIAGAVIGSYLCERAHNSADTSTNALNSLLLQLPLMGLVYLLVPLLWASGAASQEDPARLALTLCVGLTGASIIGSIARAVRGYTPDRAWWLVPAVAFTWITVGVLPSVLTDWRLTVACVVIVTAFASWRGRWSAPMFVERRYEAPSLLAAAPFLALYLVGAGVWPGHSFRSVPLLSLGLPTTESGLALALPLLEAGISATVLGYVIAEFHGRAESSFREGSSRVLFWVTLVLVATETMRSVFGYEGASLVRAVLSVGAAMYGAGLYHLQRAHVKVVARRLHSRS
jgi:VanZ family protein